MCLKYWTLIACQKWNIQPRHRSDQGLPCLLFCQEFCEYQPLHQKEKSFWKPLLGAAAWRRHLEPPQCGGSKCRFHRAGSCFWSRFSWLYKAHLNVFQTFTDSKPKNPVITGTPEESYYRRNLGRVSTLPWTRPRSNKKTATPHRLPSHFPL